MSTAQLDQKSWLEVVRLLPHVLPPIIEAVTKGQGGGTKRSILDPNWPYYDKSSQEDPQKFLNILIPILTTLVPAVIEAATKGFGVSVGGGFNSPLGGGSLSGGIQIGKSGTPADEKIWGDLVRILLPPIIDAVTKGQQPTTTAPVLPADDKFWNLIPILVPPIIDLITKGQPAGAPPTGDNEKFINILPIILPPLISALAR